MRYEIFKLKDLNLTNLQLMKEVVKWYEHQDHSRWVFKDTRKTKDPQKGELFYKVWNPTYVRRDNILTGIDVGFYDEKTTPALVGLIFHQGICRGYVMRKCDRNWRLEIDEAYDSLILERSIRTGYFHLQYSPYHAMRFNGSYSLVDLEAIYHLGELPNLNNYHCHFGWKKYEDFIIGLYNQRVSGNRKEKLFRADHGKPQFAKRPFRVRVIRFILTKVSNSLWERKGNQVSLIEV